MLGQHIKVLKEQICQPRRNTAPILLFAPKLSVKNEGKTKTFQDKQDLENVLLIKPPYRKD